MTVHLLRMHDRAACDERSTIHRNIATPRPAPASLWFATTVPARAMAMTPCPTIHEIHAIVRLEITLARKRNGLGHTTSSGGLPGYLFPPLVAPCVRFGGR